MSFLESIDSWKFCRHANTDGSTDDYSQMEHHFIGGPAGSRHVDRIQPLLMAIKLKGGVAGRCIRAKANLNFNTSRSCLSHPGPQHVDCAQGVSAIYYPQDHQSGTLFYGPDGQEIEVPCVENRLVVFPSNQLHALKTPSGSLARFVLSFVFDDGIQPQ